MGNPKSHQADGNGILRLSVKTLKDWKYHNPHMGNRMCSCRYEIVYMELFCIGYRDEQAIQPGIPDHLAGHYCRLRSSTGCPWRSTHIFIHGERPWRPGQRLSGIGCSCIYRICGAITGTRYRPHSLVAVPCSGRTRGEDIRYCRPPICDRQKYASRAAQYSSRIRFLKRSVQ